MLTHAAYTVHQTGSDNTRRTTPSVS